MTNSYVNPAAGETGAHNHRTQIIPKPAETLSFEFVKHFFFFIVKKWSCNILTYSNLKNIFTSRIQMLTGGGGYCTYGCILAGCRSRWDQPGTDEWWSPEASVQAGTGRPPCFQPAAWKQHRTHSSEQKSFKNTPWKEALKVALGIFIDFVVLFLSPQIFSLI